MLLPRSVKRWMVILPGVTTMVSPSDAPAKRDRKPAPATPRIADDRRNLRREGFISSLPEGLLLRQPERISAGKPDKSPPRSSPRRLPRPNIAGGLPTGFLIPPWV